MRARTLTAIALLLAASACNRQPAANSTNQFGNAAQSNAAAAPLPAPATPANNLAAPAAGNLTAAQEPALDQTAAEGCAGEIGQRMADQLVLQCRDVSPATRPPCNTANSCEMIRDEIRRGCGMLGADAPDFCPNGA